MHRQPDSSRENGTIMVMALFFVVFGIGLITMGSSSLKARQERTTVEINANGHATQFARAGLIEAIRWFRQQPNQPVVEFAPRRDATAKPPVLETSEPDIGIVREFKIDGTTWGRYEIWKQWDADPDRKRLEFRQRVQCEDVSSGRDMHATGAAWRLRCVGYVFDRRDENKRFDASPNRVLGLEVLETEISRLFLKPPGQAAINSGDPDGLDIKSGSQVLGGATAVGIYYRDKLGDPADGESPKDPEPMKIDNGTTSGTSSTSRATAYKDSVKDVFGVTKDVLRSMASTYVDDEEDFPDELPANGLVFVDIGNEKLDFDSKRPLRGSGMLFVDGNLHIKSGSNSFYSGLIYVTGDIDIDSPAEIKGTIIGLDKIKTHGTGDYVKVEYDGTVLDTIQMNLATYRVSRAIRRAGGSAQRH